MELSPAAWHWAKPRERPPAKLKLPEASPRGRESGPAAASNEAAKAPATTGSTRERSAWSAERHDAGLIAGVRARIDDYFDPDTIARVRAEWTGPDRLSFDRG